MSEDTTRHLPNFEARMIAELSDMRAEMRAEFRQIADRLVHLEDQAAARSRETRPLWEAVLARVTKMDSKLDLIAADLLDQRAETDMLKKRLA